MDVTETFFKGLKEVLLSAERLEDASEGLKAAGVLIPLFVIDGEIRVLLARRTERVPHHKGQVCFPGGSRDQSDSDLYATALREAKEEIGICPEDVELLGAMEPVPTVTGFFIQPFVARIPPNSAFVADDFEIAGIFDVPFSVFTDFSRYRAEEIAFQGKSHQVYFLDYESHVIWGATACILRRLAEVARGLEPCGLPGSGY